MSVSAGSDLSNPSRESGLFNSPSFVSLICLLVPFLFILPSLSSCALGLGALFLLILLSPRARSESASSQFDLAAAAFGFFIVAAPLCGAGTVTALAFLFLIHTQRFEVKIDAGWLAPLLLIFWLWTISTIFVEFDPNWFKQVGYYNSLGEIGWTARLLKFNAISFYLSKAPPHWYSITTYFLLWYCGALLTCAFSRIQKLQFGFWRGLVPGVVTAAAVAIFQLTHLGQSVTPNQSQFWNDIHRIPATFTDPNALGVFGFISLVILCAFALTKQNWSRFLIFALALCWTVVVTYSGSRSFLLGIAIFAVAYIAFSSSSVVRRAGGALLFLAILVGVALCLYHPNFDLAWLPPSFQRALSTLSGANPNDSFLSRFLFFRIDFEVWLDNFLLGCGLHRLPDLVPVYSARLGQSLGLWRDNSNSFYLGLAAETGIVGLAALAVSICRISWRSTTDTNSILLRSGAIALLVLLIFGPHLDFEEVMIAASCLVGGACIIRNYRSSILIKLVGALSCLFIPLHTYYMPFGLFDWERDGNNYFRWSGIKSQLWLPCKDGEASIMLRSLAPSLDKDPQIVNIKTSLLQQLELPLRSSSIQTQALSCTAIHDNKLDKILVDLTVNHGWIPATKSGSNDFRLLGVEVLSRAVE